MAYLFPGFTVMFMFFIVGMAAGSLLKERESGTLRRLIAAPLSRGAVVAGKMVAYILLVCLQVVVLFAIAHFAFDMPLGSSPLGLIVLTVVTGTVATGLGMLVSAIAKTAEQAESIGTILGLILAGIGGSLPMTGKPLTRAGGPLGTIANLTPHAHAIEGYYSLMAENATLVQILPEIGILLGMGVVLFVIATWRFKFE
jgi:ABC-2 type transport system permease protein